MLKVEWNHVKQLTCDDSPSSDVVIYKFIIDTLSDGVQNDIEYR